MLSISLLTTNLPLRVWVGSPLLHFIRLYFDISFIRIDTVVATFLLWTKRLLSSQYRRTHSTFDSFCWKYLPSLPSSIHKPLARSLIYFLHILYHKCYQINELKLNENRCVWDIQLSSWSRLQLREIYVYMWKHENMKYLTLLRQT